MLAVPIEPPADLPDSTQRKDHQRERHRTLGESPDGARDTVVLQRSLGIDDGHGKWPRPDEQQRPHVNGLLR
jgi:hypothetical protein